MTRTGRGFAAAQWKLPVAGLAAAGCIGLLIWQVIPSRSERTDRPKPTLVRADGTTPEPQQRRRADRPVEYESSAEDEGRQYIFDRVSSAGDVARQMDEMSTAVTGTSEGSVALAEDVRTLLEPLNSGSKDAFAEAIGRLGGSTAPGEDGRSPIDGIYTLFGGLLKYASLDAGNIEGRKPTTEIPAGDGMRIGMNRNINADPETGEETETVSHTVTGSPGRLFPSAVGEQARGKLVEMRLPFLAKGSKSETPDVVVLMQMREIAGGHWQPAGFVLDVRNQELMQSVMQELMANRPPPGGG